MWSGRHDCCFFFFTVFSFLGPSSMKPATCDVGFLFFPAVPRCFPFCHVFLGLLTVLLFFFPPFHSSATFFRETLEIFRQDHPLFFRVPFPLPMRAIQARVFKVCWCSLGGRHRLSPPFPLYSPFLRKALSSTTTMKTWDPFLSSCFSFPDRLESRSLPLREGRILNRPF